MPREPYATTAILEEKGNPFTPKFLATGDGTRIYRRVDFLTAIKLLVVPIIKPMPTSTSGNIT